MSARHLRRTLEVGGVVATVAGLHTLLTGGKSFPPWRRADSMVESEVRFYSAFYVAYGLRALRTARREDLDTHAVDELAATLLLAGLGRASAWLAVGKPHPFQRALLAIELAAPPALLWQRRAACRSHTCVPRAAK